MRVEPAKGSERSPLLVAGVWLVCADVIAGPAMSDAQLTSLLTDRGVTADASLVDIRLRPNSRGGRQGDLFWRREDGSISTMTGFRLSGEKWRSYEAGHAPVAVLVRYLPSRSDVEPVLVEDLAGRGNGAWNWLMLSPFIGLVLTVLVGTATLAKMKYFGRQ